MKVKVFAGLKDFFEPEFELLTLPQTVAELRTELGHRKPEAKSLLEKCRFAVKQNFVSLDFELTDTQEILVLPPSSGG